MNNRECIDQVERGYRMAQPSHIAYPESKTHAKELAVAQANVYKVCLSNNFNKQFEGFKIFPDRYILICNFYQISDNARMLESRAI